MAYQYTFQYQGSYSGSSYVKKEDAKMILKNHRLMGYIMGTAFFVMYGVVEIFLMNNLRDLYQSLSYKLPFYSQTSFRYVMYGLVVGLCFLIRPESEEYIDERLRQYKDGEMILVSKLIDRTYEYKMMAVAFVGALYLVFSVILPITQLTNTI